MLIVGVDQICKRWLIANRQGISDSANWLTKSLSVHKSWSRSLDRHTCHLAVPKRNLKPYFDACRRIRKFEVEDQTLQKRRWAGPQASALRTTNLAPQYPVRLATPPGHFNTSLLRHTLTKPGRSGMVRGSSQKAFRAGNHRTPRIRFRLLICDHASTKSTSGCPLDSLSATYNRTALLKSACIMIMNSTNLTGPKPQSIAGGESRGAHAA